MSENAHTSHHSGFMDRMLPRGHHSEQEQSEQQEQNEQSEQQQSEQQPEAQPQQGAQARPPFKDGERDRIQDYVDEERKLLQGGDTYTGLM